ncbi:MAG: hypothetical protein A2W90_12435 [Bacteroidetes bacterium GWF2_42_66]|nr:MAG: hypothetical protein A2W92_22990 [Bacteroidetes bacterium GWA2_42_15]OFX99993.1 MAG: hypothetical protein A2W89_17420 [Bacteroidetes bacterium GWE2_42_39]OFY40179.1 MAG: hypothetical protein A2W90_12435 [Bacteroidetes bacterium GWF2_42_66]HBL74008.1 DUF5009 domain-containing protein [Prolixibacteraceae bacterium]HCR89471.1 DUF5009 domain-containing protein [Prolixibacteraceae bacterium]
MESKSIRTEKKERLLSLDALRGFDMFWITGGSALFAFIGKNSGAEWLTRQMEHVDWAGFTMHDLIFPLFMFIAGAAIPYAIVSKLEKGAPKREMLFKVLKRMLLLVTLGVLYNGALKGNLTNIRFASVLGQIGLAYFFASVIVIYTSSFKSRLYWLGGILLGYSFMQLFIPVPDFGAGQLTPDGCINGYIDRLLLPGVLHGKVYDPEGLLCVVSATGITLMGSFAGHFLREQKRNDWQKVYLLAAIGAALIVLALIVSPFYPIIKKCWTSTFNLMAGGISFLLIAVFYMIIDVLKWQKWSFYFRVIGMNSIFVYLFTRFINVWGVVEYFLGWTRIISEGANQFILLIGYLAILWGLLYYMYKKEIFLRV